MIPVGNPKGILSCRSIENGYQGTNIYDGRAKHLTRRHLYWLDQKKTLNGGGPSK